MLLLWVRIIVGPCSRTVTTNHFPTGSSGERIDALVAGTGAPWKRILRAARTDLCRKPIDEGASVPASQEHIDGATPLGANLIADGATFRVWAPAASSVHVVRDGVDNYQPQDSDLLLRLPNSEDWAGFFANVYDGTKYRFFVQGPRASGFKRDPRARELEIAGYPDCDCLVRDPNDYPWHDAGYVPPRFEDLIVYQFHVGVFYASDSQDAMSGGAEWRSCLMPWTAWSI